MSEPRRRWYEGENKILLKQVLSLSVFAERPSYRQVIHWATNGCYGVKLQSWREGRYRKTTVEAVQRFYDKQNGKVAK